MRGGMTLDEAWQTSYSIRMAINDMVKENLKITEESRLPFF